MAGPRLLIVDDDAAMRRAVRSIFTRNGWEVCESATVAEGLRALDSPPDWLVVDLSLPDGDGTTLLRAVRAGALPTRVAVCMGQNDSDRLAEVMTLSPALTLARPVDIAALFQACQFLLNVPTPTPTPDNSGHSPSR